MLEITAWIAFTFLIWGLFFRKKDMHPVLQWLLSFLVSALCVFALYMVFVFMLLGIIGGVLKIIGGILKFFFGWMF